MDTGEGPRCLGVDAQRRPVLGPREFRREVAGEQERVAGSLPKGRNLDGEDAETIEEIGPEPTVHHRLRGIDVHRCDDARVDLHVGPASDPAYGALLERAEELRLLGHGHRRNLIEKERPAVRLLEVAYGAGRGPGEGALLVAEELVLDEVLRHRRAVHCDVDLDFRADRR